MNIGGNFKMDDFYTYSLPENDYRNYLQHYGILGMRWGVRRYRNSSGSLTTAGKKRYASSGPRAFIAKMQNDKVDRSFKKWKENSTKRDNAIELGKKMNASKIAYEKDRSNKQLKSDYKKLNKEYKKALRNNTTYRKGVVRQEVGQDISRKYLSEAKKIQKKLNSDPNNRTLQKQYGDLMSKHDVERAKARRAPSVAANRSRRIASIKRGIKVSIKAAVVSAAAYKSVELYNKHVDPTMRLNSEEVLSAIRKVRKIMAYI